MTRHLLEGSREVVDQIGAVVGAILGSAGRRSAPPGVRADGGRDLAEHIAFAHEHPVPYELAQPWTSREAAERGLDLLGALAAGEAGAVGTTAPSARPGDDAAAVCARLADYALVFGGAPVGESPLCATASDEMACAVFLTAAGIAAGGRDEAADWLSAGQCRLACAYVYNDESARPTWLMTAIEALLEGIRARSLPVVPELVAFARRERGALGHAHNVESERMTSRHSFPRPSGEVARTAEDVARAEGFRSFHSLLSDDETFLRSLDLDRAGLASVAAALAAGDVAAARDAYVEALAARLAPVLERFLAAVEPEVDTDRAGTCGPSRCPDRAGTCGPSRRPDRADALCANRVTLRAHMHREYDFGPAGIDWAACPFDDIESNVWLNAHAELEALAWAWHRTGREKYLTHLIRLMRSWLDGSPPPRTLARLQWRTLEVGNRSGQKWPVILACAIRSERFRKEILFDLARSYLAHARYLVAFRRGFGRNWSQVEAAGVGVAGLLFAQDRAESARHFALACRRLTCTNAEAFLPDGAQAECSTGYHLFPYRGVSYLLVLARLSGRRVPQGLSEPFESISDFFVWMARPDFKLPILNDWNPAEIDARAPLRTARAIIDKPAYAYIVSSREAGSPPEKTSHRFDHAGYCVMRDSWGPDALYMVFDNGYFGAGHQHEDKLNLELYAHGRPLVIDPGIYAYYPDEFLRYYRSSRGHNTVLVDGLGQNRRLFRPDERRPDPDARWITSEGFDFAEGLYADGYAAPEVQRIEDGGRMVRDVAHRRRVFFVRGRYFVVVDDVLGAGRHTVEQVFHIAPLVRAPEPGGVVPGSVETVGPAFVTADEGLANVAICRPETPDLELRVECGKRDAPPFVGWTALYDNAPSHDATWQITTELPLRLPVVLYPLRPDRYETPTVELVEASGGLAMAIEGDGWRDLFWLADHGAGDAQFAGLACSAEACHLALGRDGVPRRLLLMNGRRALFEGRPLLERDEESLAVHVAMS